MNTANTSVIRPGYLVSLKTTLAGGVSYKRVDLDTGLTVEELKAEAEKNGTTMPAVARWETTRTIDDPEEYALASTARSAARVAIVRVCTKTSFGLLCPVENEAALDAAIVAARDIARAHNANAKGTHVDVYALKGRIAGTDEEATRALVEETRSLIDEMERGIEGLDAKAIRDAATRAQEMGQMLAPEQKEKVDGAVEAARRAARQIVKRIEKDGESAAIVLADIQRGAIHKARIAFLDVDGDAAPAPASSPAMPAAPVQRVAGLDVSTEGTV